MLPRYPNIVDNAPAGGTSGAAAGSECTPLINHQELPPLDQKSLMMLQMNGDQYGDGMVGSRPLPHYDGFDWRGYGDQYGGGVNSLMMLQMNGDQYGDGMVDSRPLPHYDGFDWMEYGVQYGGGGGVVDLNDLDLSFVASEHCVPETMPNSSYGDMEIWVSSLMELIISHFSYLFIGLVIRPIFTRCHDCSLTEHMSVLFTSFNVR